MQVSILFNIITSAALILTFLLAPGCTSSAPKSLLSSDIVSLNDTKDFHPDLLAAGDQLSIKCYHNPKLNADETIRPDGNISLQMIGEIKAAGKTAPELSSAINSEYSKVFKTSTNGYSLGVGDRLSIRFYYNSELNEDLVVRPDGKISLQLVGDVITAGLTPAQLQEYLKTAYAKFLESTDITVIVREFKTPEVSINVTKFASRNVYVGGEVAKPGAVPITGMLRSVDAVLQAGGALEDAELDNVVIVRYNGTQKPDVFALNQNKILKGQLPDLKLKPYDVIYLPKTTIARVDLFVEQYLNRIIPRSVSFPLMYNFNPEVRVE